jgi:hypothetical protein
MVYLHEKLDVSAFGPSEPPARGGLERGAELGGLQRGGLWRLDEILPAAMDDLLSAWGGIAAASGVVERDGSQRAVQGDESAGHSRSPWIAAPMLEVGPLESPVSATIDGGISVF